MNLVGRRSLRTAGILGTREARDAAIDQSESLEASCRVSVSLYSKDDSRQTPVGSGRRETRPTWEELSAFLFHPAF